MRVPVLPSRRGAAAFGAVAISAALLLTSCGSTGSAAGSGPSADAVLSDAPLSIGTSYAPVNLDPAQATGIAQSLPYLSPVYDRLIELDENGVLAPMLAREWSVSSDASYLELKLRDDVSFSDGTAFNAEAVKANLDRYRTKGVPALQNLLTAVADVVVADEYIVHIMLVKGKGSDLADNLSSLPGFMVSPNAFGNSDLDVNPVGTGAYAVKPGSFISGQEVTYVKRGGQYWGGSEVFRASEIRSISYSDSNAGINALSDGEIDVLVGKPNDRFEKISSDSRFYHYMTNTAGYYQIRLNMDNPALSDVRVRQAISYAIDREALASTVNGTAQGCIASAQPLPPGPGAPEELGSAFGYDPEAARKLLAEAGKSDIVLKGLYIPSDPPSNTIAQAVQAMLSEVGINVEYTATTIPQFIESWSSGASDISPSSTSLSYRGNILKRYVNDPTLLGKAPARVLEASADMYDPRLTDEELAQVWENTSEAVVEEVSGSAIVCHSTVVALANSDIAGIDKIAGMQRGTYDAANLAKTKK